MFRGLLALVGLFIILVSGFLGLTAGQIRYMERMSGTTTDVELIELWQFVNMNLGLSPSQTLILSLIGLFLGVILTTSWWHERLKRESNWFEKRDEPLDIPPRVPGGGI